jgi:hypothetical protein
MCHLDAGEYPGYGPQCQQEGGDGGQLAGVSVPEVGYYLKTVTMNKTRKRKSISVSNAQKNNNLGRELYKSTKQESGQECK